jgi:HlyD family secretion protein
MDTQSQQDHIDDVEDLVETAENDVLKRRAQQAIEWGDLEQSLRSAKASLDAAKQDARAAEVRTAIERELLQLSVSENEANYAQLQKDIPVKRAEHEAEIRLLEITLQRQRNHLERHQSDIKKMVMYAPMAGLVVMQSIFRSGEFTQISVGDQVSPGQPFMKIVQTDSMQVEADVNQARASEFRIGQTARIGFDAFPGLYEKGRIYSIGAMAIGSWRTNAYIRNIPVRISIQGSDPRVIPDLSAYADVQVGKADNAVLAPLQAVQMDNGKPVVFVKQGEGFEKRPVQLGLSNAIQVAVLSGLSAGEVIALQKPN